MNRQVTERDFRKPEFADANPDDYEFRSDGAIVRKDRWERGIRSLVSVLGLNPNHFEIADVISKVEFLVSVVDTEEEAIECQACGSAEMTIREATEAGQWYVCDACGVVQWVDERVN